MALAWIFFRMPTFGEAWAHLVTLFTFKAGAWSPTCAMRLAVIAACLLPFEWMAYRRGDDFGPLAWPWWLRAPLYAFLVWSAHGGIGGRHPFLYFQF